MGSGSALVAAARLGRRYIGYDLDASYVDIARRRVADEAPSVEGDGPDGHEQRATNEGKAAQHLAAQVLEEAGFTIEGRNRRVRKTGVTVSLVATDADGATWFFDVAGAFTSHRGGFLRTDIVWKSLGRASALTGAGGEVPLVFLTTHLPRRQGEGDTALRAAGPNAFFDAIEMMSQESLERLRRYAKGGFTDNPQPGFWTAEDLARRST